GQRGRASRARGALRRPGDSAAHLFQGRDREGPDRRRGAQARDREAARRAARLRHRPRPSSRGLERPSWCCPDSCGKEKKSHAAYDPARVSLGELIHQRLRGAIETAVHEELLAALGRDAVRGMLFGAASPKERTSSILLRYQRRLREVNETVAATYLHRLPSSARGP